MKILISGSRYYTNYEKIYSILKEYPSNTVIIHGNCKGADLLADKAAKNLKMSTLFYNADWNKYGLAAGPIRNKLMLTDNPDIQKALIFHEDLANSKGTKNMIQRLKEFNITFEIFD